MEKEKRKIKDRKDNDELIAKSLEADEKERHNYHTSRMNRFWIWLGVLVLVAILLWWIFSIGFFEDTSGFTNFGN